MALRDLGQGLDIRRITVEVHDQQRLGALCDLALDVRRIDVPGI